MLTQNLSKDHKSKPKQIFIEEKRKSFQILVRGIFATNDLKTLKRLNKRKLQNGINIKQHVYNEKKKKKRNSSH